MRGLATWALMLSLLGCAPDLMAGRYGCETDSECPNNWACADDDRCYPSGQAPDGGEMPDAGPADAGADGEVPCEPRPVNVDLLIMVDQSGSMHGAQALLRTSLAELIDRVVQQDSDGDGIADFPRVDSLHAAVITSDMGAYVELPTCDEAGDDGVFVTTHQSDDSSCVGPFDAVQAYEGGAGQMSFTQSVQCLSQVGRSGCGFEQQLQAVLKALTPADSTVGFFDGSRGHGDDANAGFLRDDSILVTLLVTDEDDCSTHNGTFFSDHASYPGELNRRCVDYPEELLPSSRFSTGLLALRDDPRDLIFAGIIGVPLGAEDSAPNAILADARMRVQFDDGNRDPVRPTPACMSTATQGDPGRRYVEVARDISDAGGNIAIRSICEENFDGMSLDLLQRIAPRVRARVCEAAPED